ncbi:hypothetical protein BHM03_00043884 [Ensete ventricosum]|uniref:BCAS3 WD40 domain-containing protein n=1 Tax=Ensete ventricosum TaxID=4639 RepID=A0A445ML10_ENSVE|nr:hypothetical protein BHM03_00043884 [Ensete ventricosum]
MEKGSGAQVGHPKTSNNRTFQYKSRLRAANLSLEFPLQLGFRCPGAARLLPSDPRFRPVSSINPIGSVGWVATTHNSVLDSGNDRMTWHMRRRRRRRKVGGRGMRRGKGKNGLLPSSLRIISSCLKTVSSNAGSVASTVRSAGASVAASIAVPAEDEKDQVLWAGFDKLELSPSFFKHVLLLGYSNGFQVLDVDDASNVCELVSKRDGPATFLQMQPTPINSEATEGFRASHPLLLVVASDETNGSGAVQGGRLSALIRESSSEPQAGNGISSTVVRFYSLKIYCFDAVTLENKFSVLTYPLQGSAGVNIGCGPMAVGPRWLAYASNNPLILNTGRLSPQNLTPSPGVSPSTSPSSGNLVARYAMESSKTLAAGIINLGDMGYKTLSKYCHELLPDGSSSPLSSNSSRKSGRLPPTAHPSEPDNAGMVGRVPKACTTNVHMEQDGISDSHNSVEFETCFNEGYCKVSELDDCRELTEAVTDADSNSSHCEREKPDEDGDNDDLMGCVFAFSEGV